LRRVPTAAVASAMHCTGRAAVDTSDSAAKLQWCIGSYAHQAQRDGNSTVSGRSGGRAAGCLRLAAVDAGCGDDWRGCGCCSSGHRPQGPPEASSGLQPSTPATVPRSSDGVRRWTPAAAPHGSGGVQSATLTVRSVESEGRAAAFDPEGGTAVAGPPRAAAGKCSRPQHCTAPMVYSAGRAAACCRGGRQPWHCAAPGSGGRRRQHHVQCNGCLPPGASTASSLPPWHLP
jgi:hypothetical protein